VESATLGLLRCPYCGGRLELVTSLYLRREGDEIWDGILGCHCCIFPIVSGIPILHLQPAATEARDHIQAGRPDRARHTMMGLHDETRALAFDSAASKGATYRELVEALGPDFEGGYFLYRFSDPTYVVADAVVSAVAGAALRRPGRAIDLCGGSGHLTRSLVGLSRPAPVLADLYFAKVWLAKRFTAPACEPVCCDGNAPLPFARGAFRLSMCSDAFQYIWTKRQAVAEMTRLVADGTEEGVVLISHTHNQRQWSPSHGEPLPPEGYRDLFESLPARVFGEAALLSDVIKGGPLDLSRHEPDEVLDRDPALTIIATRRPDIFVAHELEREGPLRGHLRLNPLYEREEAGEQVRLRLRFPSPDYEDEYGACRAYLPDTVALRRRDLAEIEAGRLPSSLAELRHRRVVLDLPERYA
jgi:uncharacterized protein YbaR (Trm112 family)